MLAHCWYALYNFGDEGIYLCAIIKDKPWSLEAMKWVEGAKLKTVGYKDE